MTQFDPMILRGRKPHPVVRLLSNSNRERRVVPDKRDEMFIPISIAEIFVLKRQQLYGSVIKE